ncbi:MAG: 16S rRNA (guanine(966)-N(2))-methyltransferase RsmD [Dehalococcoidia bacterium]|nr:16S rRNA (guanine(966)-N(2))-methyltransferase RsmD [Dehalococcoidia bacterium]
MRVIAGEAKGRTLKWPKEPHIRPTADLVRGAIFSALESLEVDWSRALDLYAGTGALGIEALSRGAEEVDFVEQNPKCCSVIRENLEHTGLAGRAKIYRLEARKALRTLHEHYGIIFMDPPYSDQTEQAILCDVVTSGLVNKQTTIIMEHPQKLKPEATQGNFQKIRSLRHGDTCVSIYQCDGGEK